MNELAHFMTVLNGMLMVVCLGLVFHFACYIFRQFRIWGFTISGHSSAEGAIAVLTFILGDAVIRSTVLYVRLVENSGADIAPVKFWAMLAIICGFSISICGGICMLRIFSPERHGNWPWIILLGLTLAFGAFLAF